MRLFRFCISGIAVFLFLSAGWIEARVSDETADAAMKPPVINTDPGLKYSDSWRDSNMNGGVTLTKGGRLWACWTSGGDSETAFILAARSDDSGQTWSKPCLAIDPEDAPDGTSVRSLIASFWVDPSGRLWLFFDVGLGMFDGRVGLWYTRCDNPDDPQPLWSEPVRISNGSFHNKPLVLNSDHWIIPVELYDPEYVHYNIYFNGLAKLDFFPEADSSRGITLLETKDGGKTWNPLSRVLFPVSDGEEPILIANQDGSFRLFARTPKGIHESSSSDGGKTWSEPVKSFNNPVTRFLILRLQSGNLLFVRHGIDGEVEGRHQLRAWISKDEGKTWEGGLFIDERDSVAYPDGFQAEDGRIYMTYEHGRDQDAEILMGIFTEEDVLAGKPVSETASLKMLVNKATGTKRGND